MTEWMKSHKKLMTVIGGILVTAGTAIGGQEWVNDHPQVIAGIIGVLGIIAALLDPKTKTPSSP